MLSMALSSAAAAEAAAVARAFSANCSSADAGTPSRARRAPEQHTNTQTATVADPRGPRAPLAARDRAEAAPAARLRAQGDGEPPHGHDGRHPVQHQQGAPALRAPRHTSAATLRLEAAELRKVVTHAREAVGGEGTAKTVSLSAVKGQGQVEAIDEEGVDALRRAKPTDGSLLSSVESPSTA